MSNKIIINSISAVLVLGLAGMSSSIAAEMETMPAPPGMEKCYGIAKAGYNDCGTKTHNCSGEAKVDGSKDEWLFVPSGLCNKIVGGSTNPPA